MTITSGLHMTGGHPYTPRFRSVSMKNTFERTPVGSTVVVEEQMMKVAETMKELESRAAGVLENLIGEVPAIRLKSIEVEDG